MDIFEEVGSDIKIIAAEDSDSEWQAKDEGEEDG